MVSTRHHPKEFPEPDLSPSKQNPARSRAAGSASSSSKKSGRWSHTPSNLTLIWLFVSLPLVAWDTIYVFGRPHTMPGGSLHLPFYKPYDLYGRVDYIYGWKAWNEHDGFTAAQTLMNIVESLFYIYYLYLVYAFGKKSTTPGRGAPKPSTAGFLGESRVLDGPVAGLAVLIAISGAIMTVSKTALYWLQEYYSGFPNIGHNTVNQLIWLWIIPNGAWLVFPAYMIYVFGAEILEGLAIATGASNTGFAPIPLLKFE